MKGSSIVSALLFASTAVALPAEIKEKFRARRAARMEAKRAANAGAKTITHPPLAVNFTSFGDTISVDSPEEVTYSSNWAGAVIVGSDITEVTGTFTVPDISIPAGGNDYTEYGASAWVGIDGDTCGTAILQTGVEFLIEADETYYGAWYEWYPDYSYDFDDFDVTPGDVIKATVKATSTTAGTATIENVSTGASVSHTFSNEEYLGALCLQNAEWIVEDFESDSQLIPFGDFGTVTFTGAEYVTGGQTETPSGASIFDVEQDGEVVTDCGVSGSEVYCTYV